MKVPCDVIRDLLPLYADEACSEESGKLVEEHLQECPDCSSMLGRLQKNEIEDGLKSEKEDVIQYGERRFRRRSATVGSTVSGLFMVPILVCLIINIVAGSAMGWFWIMLAGLAVAASLIVVPIMVPEDKLFWTFCAFTASLVGLLGVTCLVTRGNWFWIASSAVLFGLGVIFLPFVVKAKPLRERLEGIRKAPLVLVADVALFLNMMNTIRLYGQQSGGGFITTVGVIAAVALVALGVMKNRREK